MKPKYEKASDTHLRIIETIPEQKKVTERSVEELKRDRAEAELALDRSHQQCEFYKKQMEEIDSLLSEAEKLGITEDVPVE